MAHPDLDRLLDYSLRFAQHLLSKRGAFLPFAVTVRADGELTPVALHSEEDRPEPKALLNQLSELLAQLAAAGEAVATALCYDSLVSADGESRKKDAIAVALEHSSGEAVVVYLPYRRRLLRGYSYDAVIAVGGEQKYFR